MKLDFNITRDDIPTPNRGPKGEPITSILKDFLASGKQVAELVLDDDTLDAKHRANSLCMTIRRKKSQLF